VSNQLVRQAIVAEIERAKTAWDATPGNAPLLVDYENSVAVDLSQQTAPYLAVDIIFRDGEQIDLNPNPTLCDDGTIVVAAGIKEGLGTQQVERLRDFIRPYLQLRDNLAHGVRTQAGKPYPPRIVKGFYYLPLSVTFWRHAAAPATP
jgi:hypothetical protein